MQQQVTGINVCNEEDRCFYCSAYFLRIIGSIRKREFAGRGGLGEELRGVVCCKNVLTPEVQIVLAGKI